MITPDLSQIKSRSANVPDVPAAIALVFRVTIAMAGALFLLMFLFGGIAYLTAGGNDESVGKARKMMLNAAVGLLIVLASYGVGTWIINTLTS